MVELVVMVDVTNIVDGTIVDVGNKVIVVKGLGTVVTGLGADTPTEPNRKSQQWRVKEKIRNLLLDEGVELTSTGAKLM